MQGIGDGSRGASRRPGGRATQGQLATYASAQCIHTGAHRPQRTQPTNNTIHPPTVELVQAVLQGRTAEQYTAAAGQAVQRAVRQRGVVFQAVGLRHTQNKHARAHKHTTVQCRGRRHGNRTGAACEAAVGCVCVCGGGGGGPPPPPPPASHLVADEQVTGALSLESLGVHPERFVAHNQHLHGWGNKAAGAQQWKKQSRHASAGSCCKPSQQHRLCRRRRT